MSCDSLHYPVNCWYSNANDNDNLIAQTACTTPDFDEAAVPNEGTYVHI